ncbi:hypothetical protein PISL3812_08067 [Talaromyces islandicus]|uniref:NAD-dependent epimerase/dehydratase domain-containing protein n=1 Tax=Talaromyces islandicus TaxID=28573 RepID=A0A0U1M5Y5_TALIS|nr:hypothetical protein PISL3812_08067 [Talaromyces islandicus]
MAQSRIFMTGASGYLGSVITQLAIAQGYTVHGLSRNVSNDEKLKRLGAVPIRGDLQTLDVLRAEGTDAQVIIHLADVMTRNPDYNEGLRIDAAAVDTICEALKGTDKRLLVTSGSLVTAADPTGRETTETSPRWEAPVNDRHKAEDHAMSWAEKGVHVMSIRLAPYVYGRGGSGVQLFMKMAVGRGELIYIDDGDFKTSAVHVDDAARMYLLAAEKGNVREAFNCTSSTNTTAWQLAQAMGSILDLPVKSVKFEDALATYGNFLTRFLCAVNRASSSKAVKMLGWQPREIGILEEIRTGSYVSVAQELRQELATV